MIRKSPLPRSRKPIARSPIKKRPRKKSETLRIYGPPGFIEWIHAQKCVGCGFTPSSCAHIKTGGTGRKDDWTRTVPLCSRTSYRLGCHGMLHTLGRRDFETLRDINLEAEAAKTQELFRASLGSAPGGQT